MSISYSISGWNRRRKWRLFLEKIRPTEEQTVLDVGFNAVEYSSTDNFLEKNYLYPQNITAVGIDDPGEFIKKYPEVKAVRYDGDVLPFADQSFDVCWSNAVLEHVGGTERQIRFLKEIKRVAKHGFITTPNKNFPIEVHTRTPLLHFMPKQIFDLFLKLTGRKWATGDYMNLLGEKQLREILAAAGIEKYELIRNKLFGLTLDFVVIF